MEYKIFNLPKTYTKYLNKYLMEYYLTCQNLVLYMSDNYSFILWFCFYILQIGFFNNIRYEFKFPIQLVSISRSNNSSPLLNINVNYNIATLLKSGLFISVSWIKKFKIVWTIVMMPIEFNYYFIVNYEVYLVMANEYVMFKNISHFN